MKRIIPIVLGLLLVAPAWAHRLDEYLQGTFLSVDPDRVTLELSLTPGVSVAPAVMALIDTDRDGQISAMEAEAYTRVVANSQVLKVDRHRIPLEVTGKLFPTPSDLRSGAGVIHIGLGSKTVDLAPGLHQIVLENRHQAGLSTYLVNVLVPESKEVRIIRQKRDLTQTRMELEIAVGPLPTGPAGLAEASSEASRWPWWLATASGTGLIWFGWRGRRG